MRYVTYAASFGLAVTLLSACAAQNRGDAVATTPTIATADIISHFEPENIIGTPRPVDCTLSGGAAAQCLSITVRAAPKAFTVGPWCPRNISDGPDVSGIWLDAGTVYDADGAFIQNLSTFYKDKSWQLFDPETGKIRVTDSKISCAAAARPDVAAEYQNHCVECQLDYLDPDLTQTYVTPLQPVAAVALQPRVGRSGVGVAFSGVKLEASAPVQDILSAHTLAPFDDCGGHVNLHVGYHLHAVTDCLSEVVQTTSDSPMVGLALDGYPIHSRLRDIEGDLDVCRGHATDTQDYHYHVNDPGANAILGCHKAQTGCVLNSSDDVCDASQSERRGPPQGAGDRRGPPRGEEGRPPPR